VRLLAFADQPPPVDAAEVVAQNAPDAVVTLGDLEPAWIASLASLGLPKLGVHGNHDRAGDLPSLGVRDLHLDRAELGGWSFAGFEGCVRYRDGPYQYTQEEAAALVPRLPAADVLLCHCPPSGVNDEPDDPAHVGFAALRAWVERHRPRYLLHGHTTPDPRTRTHRLGQTEVVWVRGATAVELVR
jgi:Icc-related predicted phosphoesterase